MSTFRTFQLVLAACLVVGGCTTRSADPAADVVVGGNTSASSIPTATVPIGVGTEAADVEAAFAEYIACMENFGFSGTIRFDLSRSTVTPLDVAVGTDPDEGTRKLTSCRDPFDAILIAFQRTHPETDHQLELFRLRIVACGDRLFPGQIDGTGSYDDVLQAYQMLAMATPQEMTAANECWDTARAGPALPFGR